MLARGAEKLKSLVGLKKAGEEAKARIGALEYDPNWTVPKEWLEYWDKHAEDYDAKVRAESLAQGQREMLVSPRVAVVQPGAVPARAPGTAAEVAALNSELLTTRQTLDAVSGQLRDCLDKLQRGVNLTGDNQQDAIDAMESIEYTIYEHNALQDVLQQEPATQQTRKQLAELRESSQKLDEEKKTLLSTLNDNVGWATLFLEKELELRTALMDYANAEAELDRAQKEIDDLTKGGTIEVAKYDRLTRQLEEARWKAGAALDRVSWIENEYVELQREARKSSGNIDKAMRANNIARGLTNLMETTLQGEAEKTYARLEQHFQLSLPLGTLKNNVGTLTDLVKKKAPGAAVQDAASRVRGASKSYAEQLPTPPSTSWALPRRRAPRAKQPTSPAGRPSSVHTGSPSSLPTGPPPEIKAFDTSTSEAAISRTEAVRVSRVAEDEDEPTKEDEVVANPTFDSDLVPSKSQGGGSKLRAVVRLKNGRPVGSINPADYFVQAIPAAEWKTSPYIELNGRVVKSTDPLTVDTAGRLVPKNINPAQYQDYLRMLEYAPRLHQTNYAEVQDRQPVTAVVSVDEIPSDFVEQIWLYEIGPTDRNEPQVYCYDDDGNLTHWNAHLRAGITRTRDICNNKLRMSTNTDPECANFVNKCLLSTEPDALQKCIQYMQNNKHIVANLRRSFGDGKISGVVARHNLKRMGFTRHIEGNYVRWQTVHEWLSGPVKDRLGATEHQRLVDATELVTYFAFLSQYVNANPHLEPENAEMPNDGYKKILAAKERERRRALRDTAARAGPFPRGYRRMVHENRAGFSHLNVGSSGPFSPMMSPYARHGSRTGVLGGLYPHGHVVGWPHRHMVGGGNSQEQAQFGGLLGPIGQAHASFVRDSNKTWEPRSSEFLGKRLDAALEMAKDAKVRLDPNDERTMKNNVREIKRYEDKLAKYLELLHKHELLRHATGRPDAHKGQQLSQSDLAKIVDLYEKTYEKSLNKMGTADRHITILHSALLPYGPVGFI